MSAAPHPALPLARVLGDEGFRLFFPLGALYAAIWPLQWVLVFGQDLPLVRTTPPAFWHAHEMIFGAFGAALLGFLTTAIPEWTDTPRLRGRALYLLALLWAGGRLVGFFGADAVGWLGAVCDLGWLGLLLGYAVRISVLKRRDDLLGFILWLAALTGCEAGVRLAFLTDDAGLAQLMLHVAGLAFLGLLGLALARTGVAVSNLILDPSGATAPFRPHPGRLNLASGLVALAALGDLVGLSPEASGWLMIAAGAGFMDRAGETFVGRAALRAEIAVLGGSSLLAGLGLMAVGAGRLGAPIGEVAGLHVVLMGGLGMGVLAVFSIAGLMHAGHALVFPRGAKVAALLLVAAVGLRVLPDLGLVPDLPGPAYGGAAILWAAAWLVWLQSYWPVVSRIDLDHIDPERADRP